MPNVIKSLLVGIGFDLDKKSMGVVDSGLDAITSKATKLGAVVAGAFGIKALTSDFAAAKDVLGKFAQVNGVAAHQVNALGNALQSEGGSLQGAMSILESINGIRDRLRRGEAGIFADAGLSNFDATPIIEAKDAMQAYLAIAEKYSQLDKADQRNLRGVFGFDDASMRLLSQGRPKVEAQLAEWGNIRPITDEMTKAAAEFNTNMQKLNENIGGFADIIGNDMTQAAANSAKWLNDLLDENRPEIRSFIEGVMEGDIDAIYERNQSSPGQGRKNLIRRRTSESSAEFDAAARQSAESFMSWVGTVLSPQHTTDRDFGEGPMARTGGNRRRPVVVPVRLELDGPAVKRQVIDITDEINQQTMDDLSSDAEGG